MLEIGVWSYIYSICTLVGDALTVLWIYVIVKHSSMEMNRYKWCLLKLAMCDLSFSLSICVFLTPDLLLPLPAAVCNGIFPKLAGHFGARIALCQTVITAMTVFTAINDCCYVRSLIVYEQTEKLDFIFSLRGAIFVVAINIVFAIFVVPAVWIALLTKEELFAYAANSNQTRFLAEYHTTPDAIYLGIDPISWNSVPLLIVGGGGLIMLHVGNFLSAGLTMAKINESRKHMSAKTFKQQRQFTIMLICQNLYPVIAITVPVAVVSFGQLFSISVLAESTVIEHLASMAVLLYPTASCSFSFYFVKPYREFVRRKLVRIPGVKRFLKIQIVTVQELTRSTVQP